MIRLLVAPRICTRKTRARGRAVLPRRLLAVAGLLAALAVAVFATGGAHAQGPGQDGARPQRRPETRSDGGSLPPAGADRTREAVGRVLSRPGYQTDLPGEERGAKPPWWSSEEPGGRPSWTIPVPAGTGAVLELLVWVLAGVAVVLLLWVVGQWLLAFGWRRSGRAPRDDVSGEAEAEASGRPRGRPELPEADRLAAEGRFAEAVHVLLIRALGKIAEGRGRSFAESATSREILDSGTLAAGQRPLLRRLVDTVERSLFGGAEVGAEEYEDCRRAYAGLGGGS